MISTKVKKPITQEEREAIKAAMILKVQEINGEILSDKDRTNEKWRKNVLGQKLVYNAKDVIRKLIVMDPQTYDNITHGSIRIKNPDYYKLVKYFQL